MRELQSDRPFLVRPELCGLKYQDHDERITDQRYRDLKESTVGLRVAAEIVIFHGECAVVRVLDALLG